MTIKKKPKQVHRSSSVEQRIHEPEYMVQLNDPASMRRDILESLREVILFMQGYEKFRKLQEEKIAIFNQLKNDVKELNQMIDSRLRKYFPKGKLKAITEKEGKEEREVEYVEVKKPKVEVVAVAQPRERVALAPAASELDELESQLKDIENQLQNIK
ncbi:hypothetical protein J4444_02785 [Candidatus Woesearchaeota archaeon]|nr:hypothetical protein [Candidatus Woesearchaeota archaeon]